MSGHEIDGERSPLPDGPCAGAESDRLSRPASGADPWKLNKQIGKLGASTDGIPPIFVYEDPDGVLEISDGVTRATRIAKLAPGATVPVIVIGHYRRSRSRSPRGRDRL